MRLRRGYQIENEEAKPEMDLVAEQCKDTEQVAAIPLPAEVV